MNQLQYHPYQSDDYMSIDSQYAHGLPQTTTYDPLFNRKFGQRLDHCSLGISDTLNFLESSAYIPPVTQQEVSLSWPTDATMTNNFWPQTPHQAYQQDDSMMINETIGYSNPSLDATFTNPFTHHFNGICDPRLLESNGMELEAPSPPDPEYHYGFGEIQPTSTPGLSPEDVMETDNFADNFGGERFAALTLSQSSNQDDVPQNDYPCSTFRNLDDRDEYANFCDEPVAPEPDDANEEPYAKLIWRALMTKESRSMVLQEIYDWFDKNTGKSKTSGTKGWQNSIRHNLSMNGAFIKSERVQSGDDTKKHCEWVLDPVAEKEGVKSTTRYRNKVLGKRTTKHDPPSGARQNSGRLGGQRSAGRFRAQKQKIKPEPTERLETRLSKDEPLLNHKSLFTCGSKGYSMQHTRPAPDVKVEESDSKSPLFIKQDPTSAFGNVKGIFEDPDLRDLPPFVGGETPCLSPVPEAAYGYPYN